MVASLIVLMTWVIIGCSGIWFDHYIINHKLDLINVPMVIFIVLTPCFPFIFHWCSLF